MRRNEYASLGATRTRRRVGAFDQKKGLARRASVEAEAQRPSCAAVAGERACGPRKRPETSGALVERKAPRAGRAHVIDVKWASRSSAARRSKERRDATGGVRGDARRPREITAQEAARGGHRAEGTIREAKSRSDHERSTLGPVPFRMRTSTTTRAVGASSAPDPNRPERAIGGDATRRPPKLVRGVVKRRPLEGSPTARTSDRPREREHAQRCRR